MGWLSELLTNSWMANPLFTTQMAHLFFAAFVAVTCQLLRIRLRRMLWIAVPAFLLKEYWFDLKYEHPPDTVAGSTLDFVMYMSGLALGLGIVWMSQRIPAAARHCRARVRSFLRFPIED